MLIIVIVIVSQFFVLPPPKEGGYIFTSVCLSVCLSARLLKVMNGVWWIFWRDGACPGERSMVAIWVTIWVQGFWIRITIWVHLGSRSGFIFCCNSYSQPRIKHENAWWRFELSECILVFSFYTTNWESRDTRFPRRGVLNFCGLSIKWKCGGTSLWFLAFMPP